MIHRDFWQSESHVDEKILWNISETTTYERTINHQPIARYFELFHDFLCVFIISWLQNKHHPKNLNYNLPKATSRLDISLRLLKVDKIHIRNSVPWTMGSVWQILPVDSSKRASSVTITRWLMLIAESKFQMTRSLTLYCRTKEENSMHRKYVLRSFEEN